MGAQTDSLIYKFLTCNLDEIPKFKDELSKFNPHDVVSNVFRRRIGHSKPQVKALVEWGYPPVSLKEMTDNYWFDNGGNYNFDISVCAMLCDHDNKRCVEFIKSVEETWKGTANNECYEKLMMNYA